MFDADDRSIDNMRMRQKNSLELGRRNLEATDFDELLLSVYNVPFLGLAVAVDDVACLEEAL